VKILAISDTELNLMLTSAGTLIKLSKNHEINLAIIKIKKSSEQENMKKIISSNLKVSTFHFINNFDSFSITQNNVFQIRNIVEAINPEIIFFPFYMSKDTKFANLGHVSLLAGRDTKNLLMFEPHQNSKFVPTINSDVKKYQHKKTKLVSGLLKSLKKKSNSLKKVSLNSDHELFQSHRIILLDGVF